MRYLLQLVNYSMSSTTQKKSSFHKAYNQKVETRGIEPRAFCMQSRRSTTELNPLFNLLIVNT